MTASERWDAWDNATPREQQIMLAWFIGACADDFDQATAHAKKVAAEEEAAWSTR